MHLIIFIEMTRNLLNSSSMNANTDNYQRPTLNPSANVKKINKQFNPRKKKTLNALTMDVWTPCSIDPPRIVGMLFNSGKLMKTQTELNPIRCSTFVGSRIFVYFKQKYHSSFI